MTVCRFDDDEVDKDGLVRFQIERRPRGDDGESGGGGGASLLRTRTEDQRLVIAFLIMMKMIVVVVVVVVGVRWRLTRMTGESRGAERCFPPPS